MKIKLSQLKQIIREEVAKAGGAATPDTFECDTCGNTTNLEDKAKGIVGDTCTWCADAHQSGYRGAVRPRRRN